MGPNDRIEPNYFQHTHVDFLAENIFDFYYFLSSPGSPGGSWTKKTGNILKILTFYENSENRNFSRNRNFRVGGTRPEGPVK